MIHVFSEDFSKFRMLYNDAVKKIQEARQKANSELGLELKADIGALLLAGTE